MDIKWDLLFKKINFSLLSLIWIYWKFCVQWIARFWNNIFINAKERDLYSNDHIIFLWIFILRYYNIHVGYSNISVEFGGYFREEEHSPPPGSIETSPRPLGGLEICYFKWSKSAISLLGTLQCRPQSNRNSSQRKVFESNTVYYQLYLNNLALIYWCMSNIHFILLSSNNMRIFTIFCCRQYWTEITALFKHRFWRLNIQKLTVKFCW